MSQNTDIGRGASGPQQERGQFGTADAAGWAWMTTAIAFVAASVVLALFWDRPITDDVAWYLIGTRDWLGGAPLYEMVVEVNPPLNFYFTVPAVLIADLFGLSDVNGQYVLTALILFGSLAWCGAIIRSELDLPPERQALFLAGIAVAIVVPTLDSMGQREQTMTILMMPWLLGQIAPGTPSARRDLPRALVAAFGICLKPHFVVFPIAVTLVRMARSRSLRPILSPANLTFLSVGLAYVAYVAAVHPAYLFEIVPIASKVYGAYRTQPDMIVAAVYPKVLLLLFPALVALRDREGRSSPGMLGAVTLAGLVCFIWQGTGFPYHLIPLTVFGMVTCLLILMRARTFGLFIAAVTVAYVGLATLGIRQGYPKHPAVEDLVSVLDDVGEFDSFIAFSSSLFAGPPVAMATGADWSSRYPANWLVPGAIKALVATDCEADPETCADLRNIAAKNRTENIDDMLRTKPDLLIVDRNSGYFYAPQFDWLAFMAEDPAWTEVFRHYREVASTERFLYFRREP